MDDHILIAAQTYIQLLQALTEHAPGKHCIQFLDFVSMHQDAYAYFHNSSYVLLFPQVGKDASNAFHRWDIDPHEYEGIFPLVDSFQQQQMNKLKAQKVK